MEKFRHYCDECGCKLALKDKFCTECGLFLSMPLVDAKDQMHGVTSDSKVKVDISQASITTSLPSSRSPAQPEFESPTITSSTRQVSQQPKLAPSSGSAQPKSSSMTVVFTVIGLVVVGGAGAYFALKGGSLNEPIKVSAAISTQKQSASNASNVAADKLSQAVTVTGQMLVDSAANGNQEEFQKLMAQLQTRPVPASVDRKKARSLNDEAIKALKSDDPGAAIELFNKAREADPGDAEISNNLGHALRTAGKLKESEAQLLSTIEQFPTRQQAWQDLGETYSKSGKHSQAVSALMTAHRLAKNPDMMLERYSKISESTVDDGFKNDLVEAIKKISEAKK